MEHKRQLVAEYLESIDKHIIWDIGANTGMFSRIAAANGAYTLSFDNDPGAVELNYRQCKSDRIENVLPLVTDLTNPTPAIGWENTERLSLLDRANADAVLALALVHHLSIGNNLSFERIASFFRSLGKWLLIEFVPKEDPQVQRLLASREDIFTEYNENSFVQQFQIHYKIHRRAEIRDSGRGLYLMEGN
jgi:ribosomal protein L11 methylase PrmA